MYGLLCIAVLLSIGSPPAGAHEGHDHGADEPPPPVTATLSPRTSSASGQLEVVIALSGTQLVVYLDDYASNAPVADAVVDVVAGTQEARATQRATGEYVVDTGALGIDAGETRRHALTLVVETADEADLLPVTLDVTGTPPADAGARTAGTLAWWAMPVLLLLGGGWWRRYRLTAARRGMH